MLNSNCVIYLSDSLTVHLCKHVKMFILRTYANEEKRSQDMNWKRITRYLATGHCLWWGLHCHLLRERG